MQPGGARLVQGRTRVLQDATGAHLFAISRLAVGAVGMDEVVFHVQDQIDGVAHAGVLQMQLVWVLSFRFRVLQQATG